jgi:hypothetical protein
LNKRNNKEKKWPLFDAMREYNKGIVFKTRNNRNKEIAHEATTIGELQLICMNTIIT